MTDGLSGEFSPYRYCYESRGGYLSLDSKAALHLGFNNILILTLQTNVILGY